MGKRERLSVEKGGGSKGKKGRVKGGKKGRSREGKRKGG